MEMVFSCEQFKNLLQFTPAGKNSSPKLSKFLPIPSELLAQKLISEHLIFMFALFNYANERKILEFILIAKEKKVSEDLFRITGRS